ncbi:MAG: Gfo/Idh/MocA family oxidoreductase [Clostridia bacterium]|nr:Gfo/Idh/MocA family oxidoreductase [Clostridia bacterium]
MARFKVGIFGAGRGREIAKDFLMLGCEIVAICDFDIERRNNMVETLELKDALLFEDFEEFFKVEMDIMVLTNYFHEHAPYAIRCLEKGIHVYSECISNGTMAEGVALMEAAEKSDAVYMLAENYPQGRFNIEMMNTCKSGKLGKIVYAEGEYVHPANPANSKETKALRGHKNHWRNWLPVSYYVTHSIGPLMRATDATPQRVCAFAAFAEPEYREADAVQVKDITAIITTYNDDRSVFKVTGCAGYGHARCSYRFCGTKGQTENLRQNNFEVCTNYNSWQVPEGEECRSKKVIEWNDPDNDKILKSGHSGSDYVTARMFIDCIEKGEQPPFPFNVDGGIAMSSVAILAHRSILEGGKPYEIPNFREEKWKEIYRNDTLCPMPLTDGTMPSIACNSIPGYEPTKEQIENFEKAMGTVTGPKASIPTYGLPGYEDEKK